jgi:hypothetical protein
MILTFDFDCNSLKRQHTLIFPLHPYLSYCTSLLKNLGVLQFTTQEENA